MLATAFTTRAASLLGRDIYARVGLRRTRTFPLNAPNNAFARAESVKGVGGFPGLKVTAFHGRRIQAAYSKFNRQIT